MKMQLSDLRNRWFGENFIIPRLTAAWVEHNIHNCCQNQLVASRYREHVQSSNWNALWRVRDGGTASDQISSVLLAVRKQPLINSAVAVRRRVTPRLPTHARARSLREGRLPVYSLTYVRKTDTHSCPLTLFHQRFISTLFELWGGCH